MPPRLDQKPILINKNCIALIQLFTRTNTFTEMILSEYEIEDIRDAHSLAAKEFVNQLEGQWCVDFMEKLREEIDMTIKKHKEEYRMEP